MCSLLLLWPLLPPKMLVLYGQHFGNNMMFYDARSTANFARDVSLHVLYDIYIRARIGMLITRIVLQIIIAHSQNIEMYAFGAFEATWHDCAGGGGVAFGPGLRGVCMKCRCAPLRWGGRMHAIIIIYTLTRKNYVALILTGQRKTKVILQTLFIIVYPPEVDNIIMSFSTYSHRSFHRRTQRIAYYPHVPEHRWFHTRRGIRATVQQTVETSIENNVCMRGRV